MIQPHLLIIGAGPGVAMGVARRFGREGFRVTLLARKPDSLDQLRAELTALGVDVATYAADVADFDGFRRRLEQAVNERGAVTVLHYNPSVYREADALTLDPALFMQDMRINGGGLLVAVQALCPAMIAAGSGTVLVTGGGSALHPSGPLLSLSVGKAAVRTMAECVRQTLEPQGIHVATVTINGSVGSNEHFSPDRIAEAFWSIHQQPRFAWTFELIH
ncbi:short-chain dehydrogenase/reductase SDR [Fibrella aestuarina BUZ 2]|uniref:Short-chain dehydrogenase/reductase SDR n=1 Tax=Fibrella aestuarina BUZ 2 TaxID=1166018 RepID=I0K817_9BACT|nr:SDR family NAD(P)-dependent oxidoreductase [Fibrella aestuarina]CCH00270.1 short-chain dehydrogenase/reductase SDR [Fibrella aestuarina BUZ 2]